MSDQKKADKLEKKRRKKQREERLEFENINLKNLAQEKERVEQKLLNERNDLENDKSALSNTVELMSQKMARLEVMIRAERKELDMERTAKEECDRRRTNAESIAKTLKERKAKTDKQYQDRINTLQEEKNKQQADLLALSTAGPDDVARLKADKERAELAFQKEKITKMKLEQQNKQMHVQAMQTYKIKSEAIEYGRASQAQYEEMKELKENLEEKLEKSNYEVDKFKGEVDILKADLELSQKSKHVESKQLAYECQEKIEAKEHVITKQNVDILNLKLNHETMKQEKARLECERSHLLYQTEQINRAMKTFEDAYGEKNRELSMTKSTVKHQSSLNMQLKNEIQNLDNKLKQQTATSASLSKEIVNLTAAKNQALETAKTFDARMDEKQVELEEVQRKYAELHDTSSHEIGQLKNNIKLSDVSMRNAEAEAKKFQQVAVDKESENAKFEEKIATLQEETVNLSAKLTKTQDELSTTRDQREHFKKAAKQIKMLEMERTASKQRHKSLVTENEGIKRELAAVQERNQKLREHNRKLTTNCGKSTMKDELEIADLKSEIATLTKSLSASRDELETLKVETLANLQSKFAEIEQENQDNLEKIKSLSQSRKEFRDSVMEEKDRICKDKKAVEDRLNGLQMDLTSERAEKERMRKEYYDQSRTDMHQIGSLEGELTAIRVTHKNEVAKTEQLQGELTDLRLQAVAKDKRIGELSTKIGVEEVKLEKLEKAYKISEDRSADIEEREKKLKLSEHKLTKKSNKRKKEFEKELLEHKQKQTEKLHAEYKSKDAAMRKKYKDDAERHEQAALMKAKKSADEEARAKVKTEFDAAALGKQEVIHTKRELEKKEKTLGVNWHNYNERVTELELQEELLAEQQRSWEAEKAACSQKLTAQVEQYKHNLKQQKDKNKSLLAGKDELEAANKKLTAKMNKALAAVPKHGCEMVSKEYHEGEMNRIRKDHAVSMLGNQKSDTQKMDGLAKENRTLKLRVETLQKESNNRVSVDRLEKITRDYNKQAASTKELLKKANRAKEENAEKLEHALKEVERGQAKIAQLETANKTTVASVAKQNILLTHNAQLKDKVTDIFATNRMLTTRNDKLSSQKDELEKLVIELKKRSQAKNEKWMEEVAEREKLRNANDKLLEEKGAMVKTLSVEQNQVISITEELKAANLTNCKLATDNSELTEKLTAATRLLEQRTAPPKPTSPVNKPPIVISSSDTDSDPPLVIDAPRAIDMKEEEPSSDDQDPERCPVLPSPFVPRSPIMTDSDDDSLPSSPKKSRLNFPAGNVGRVSQSPVSPTTTPTYMSPVADASAVTHAMEQVRVNSEPQEDLRTVLKSRRKSGDRRSREFRPGFNMEMDRMHRKDQLRRTKRSRSFARSEGGPPRGRPRDSREVGYVKTKVQNTVNGFIYQRRDSNRGSTRGVYVKLHQPGGLFLRNGDRVSYITVGSDAAKTMHAENVELV